MLDVLYAVFVSPYNEITEVFACHKFVPDTDSSELKLQFAIRLFVKTEVFACVNCLSDGAVLSTHRAFHF